MQAADFKNVGRDAFVNKLYLEFTDMENGHGPGMGGTFS